MIRVLLADASERIVANLTRRLAAEDDITLCAVTVDGDATIQASLHQRPDVAVIDANLPGMDGIQVTEMLAQFAADTGVILMSLDSENDLFRRAMLAGAREVLQKPFPGDDLVESIRRVHEFQARKRVATAVPAPAQNGEVAAAGSGAAATATKSDGGPPPAGKLITVVAGKGGVGKSLVATNLAVLLARQHRGKVALVDLSLQFGDVAALLDIKTPTTIAHLAANDAAAERETVESALAEGPDGLHVLAAPSSPEQADYVTTHHLRALLDELRRTHDLVVADTTSQLNEITLEAIENSARVVLLSDTGVTGVKNTRLVMSVLEVLRLPAERILLVANHRDPRTEHQLDRAQMESFLHVPVRLEIPNEQAAVAASVSRGVPIAKSNPQSGVARAIAQLAELVDAETSERAAAGGAAAAPAPRKRRRLGFARD